MPIKEWVRKQKLKKRNCKYYQKTYIDAKDIFNEYKFSDGMIQMVESNHELLTKNFDKLKNM